MAISGYVSAQINVAKKLSERARDYYLARAAVERAILEVKNDSTDKHDALTDSWSANDAVFKECPLGDGTYSVLSLSAAENDVPAVRYGMSDEESKINVNKAPIDILKNFFETVGGVDEEKATAIAASILNWRNPAGQSEKEGADAFHYQALDHPYECKNAPFEAPEELLLVEGITEDIFDKVKTRLTVYGSGAVNINTADEMVLRSIGMSGELAGKIIHFRESEPSKGGSADEIPNYFDNTANIVNYLTKKESLSAEESGKISGIIARGLLSVTSDNFGGLAVGKAGNGPGGSGAKITFVFDRKNNVMRYWRE